jgi:phosphatidylserine/phosphatidylglycerophosphate/cardiolipin synthase-like enzyme
MKAFVSLLFIVLLLNLPAWRAPALAETPAARPCPPIEIYFSPNGGSTDAILKQINTAKRAVLVQAYWFTSVPITKALVEAHKRGVAVQVILDLSRTQMDNTQAQVLVENGVPTFVDDQHTTAHSKVMIVDGEVVITGSFNFTEQSEKENVENLLVIHDKAIAAKYVANWELHVKHSPRYRKQ